MYSALLGTFIANAEPYATYKTVKTLNYKNYDVQIVKTVSDVTRYFAMIPGKGVVMTLIYESDNKSPVKDFTAFIDAVSPILN